MAGKDVHALMIDRLYHQRPRQTFNTPLTGQPPAGGGAGQIKPECDFWWLVMLWPAAVSLKPCFLGNINSSVLNSLQEEFHPH